VNWSSGFLPAVYQGTAFRPGESPILYLERRTCAPPNSSASLDLLKQPQPFRWRPSPVRHRAACPPGVLRTGRPHADGAPAADLSKESEATLKLYGIDDPTSESYGKVLLRARRLVERGVRFVQVVSGYPSNISDQERRSWDAHSDLDGNHATQARMDKPIAGLLTDLKALGLLDTTLVVWASEFSRTSWGESGTGRDHNPWGYTQWLAGGG
jgi:hypothetical protein